MYFGGLSNQTAMEQASCESPVLYKPRTLREQITDRIAYHQSQIDNLKEALDAMSVSPEVERAINALQKL